MKRLCILLAVSLVVFSFSACKEAKDKINEATTTSVTTDLVVPLKVMESSAQKDDIVFQCEEHYSILSNETLKEYLGGISDIEIVGVDIKIVEATPGNMILKHAQFKLQGEDSNSAFNCSTPHDFPIVVNKVYSVEEDETNWQVLNDIIDDLGDIHVSCEGVASSDTQEAVFALEFIIKVKATVSANL